DYDQALRLQPNSLPAVASRGICHAATGQRDASIKDYDQAIHLQPRDAFDFNARGGAFFQMGQTDRAIQDYDQAIALKPDFSAAYYNRGLPTTERDRSIVPFGTTIRSSASGQVTLKHSLLAATPMPRRPTTRAPFRTTIRRSVCNQTLPRPTSREPPHMMLW